MDAHKMSLKASGMCIVMPKINLLIALRALMSTTDIAGAEKAEY